MNLQEQNARADAVRYEPGFVKLAASDLVALVDATISACRAGVAISAQERQLLHPLCQAADANTANPGTVCLRASDYYWLVKLAVRVDEQAARCAVAPQPDTWQPPVVTEHTSLEGQPTAVTSAPQLPVATEVTTEVTTEATTEATPAKPRRKRTKKPAA